METKPKLKVELSSTDKVLEVLSWIILVTWWVFVLFSFTRFPHTIPTHFNASGDPDSYGNKSTIFMLPIIGTALVIGLTILNNYPHIFNYGTGFNRDNALNQYTTATRIIRYFKLLVVIVFAIISFLIYSISRGKSSGLGSLFLPAIIILFSIPIIFIMIQTFKFGKKAT